MITTPEKEQRIYDAVHSVTGRILRPWPQHETPRHAPGAVLQASVDFARIEKRIHDHYSQVNRGVPAAHGRVLYMGQIWRSNDPRRLRGVRIIDFDLVRRVVVVGNIVTNKLSEVPIARFTIGREGYSLEQDIRWTVNLER
jgi:hypothetical protein